MKAEGRKQKAEVRTTKRISHFSLLPSAFCLLPSFALFFFACAPPPPPRTTPAPPPPLTATATARRVILVSFDGLGADALASQTDLPAFEALARDGASALIVAHERLRIRVDRLGNDAAHDSSGAHGLSSRMGAADVERASAAPSVI